LLGSVLDAWCDFQKPQSDQSFNTTSLEKSTVYDSCQRHAVLRIEI